MVSRIALICAVLLGTLFVGGCQNATRKISRDAIYISDIAHDTLEVLQIAEDVNQASSASEEQKADLSGLLGTANGYQEEIIGKVHSVQDQLPNVEDKRGLFEQLLDSIQWWGYAIAGVVLLIILWRTGLGFLIRRIAWRFGVMIGDARKEEAMHDYDVIENGMSHKEAVAIRRSKDPEYDAAWRRIKRLEQKEHERELLDRSRNRVASPPDAPVA